MTKIQNLKCEYDYLQILQAKTAYQDLILDLIFSCLAVRSIRS